MMVGTKSGKQKKCSTLKNVSRNIWNGVAWLTREKLFVFMGPTVKFYSIILTYEMLALTVRYIIMSGTTLL
jgi:hypothetical protein